MMTILGKTLVITTLVMSIVLLGISLTIFGSQQILTPPAGGQGTTPPGNRHQKEYAERSQRFKDADAALQRARKRWDATIADLEAIEKDYNAQPKFYQDEISALEDGAGDMNTVALQDGKPKVDDKHRVEMEKAKDGLGQPVQNAQFYRKRIEEEHAKVADLSRQLAGDPNADDPKKKIGLIRWHDNLTRLLFEELDEKQDPRTRGLRVDLDTEKYKHSQLEKELEYLDDTTSKIVVDNGALSGRYNQMSARKKELEDKLKGRK